MADQDAPQSLEGMTPDEAQKLIAPNPSTPAPDAPETLEGMTPQEAAQYIQKSSAPSSLEGMTPDEAQQHIQSNQPDSSAVGAFARSAAKSVVPFVGSLPAIGAGAEAGGMAGAAAAPFLGPAAPIAPAAGAIIGGGLAAFGMGSLIQKGQQYVLDKLGLSEGTGELSNAQAQADIQQHPYASLAGELAAGGVAFRPGTATKAARAVGAAIFGGQEAAQEYANNENFDPAKIALSAGAGAILSTPKEWAQRQIDVGASTVAKFRAGRPDVKPTSDSLTEKDEATPTNPVPAGSIGRAADPVDPQQDTVSVGNQDKSAGNKPQAAGPEDYRKNAAAPPENAGVETGDMHSDIAAALNKNQEQELPPPTNKPVLTPEATGQTPAAPPEPVAPAASVPAAEETPPPQQGKSPAYEKAPSTLYSHPDPDLPDVVIDRRKPVPGLVQLSPDGTRVNIDPRVPQQMVVRGVRFNPDIPISLRNIAAEQTRSRIVDMVEASGGKAPDGATLTNEAQAYGNQAMDEWLVRNGVDTKMFRSQMDKIAKGVGEPVETATPAPKVVSDVQEKLKAAGQEDLANKLAAAPAEQQPQLAMKAQAALQGAAPKAEYANVRVRAPEKKLSNGQTVRTKDFARKQGAIDAASGTFNDERFQQLPVDIGDKSPEAKAKLKDFAQSVTDDAIKRNNGAHPNDVYKMADKSKEYMFLDLMRKLNKKGGMGPKALDKFYSDYDLLRKGGEQEVKGTNRINADIELTKKPEVEQAEMGEEAQPVVARTDFEQLPEWKPGSDFSKPEIDASNKLRSWINDLSGNDYDRLVGEHPDLVHDVNLTQDPEELLRNYQDVLAEPIENKAGPAIKSEEDLRAAGVQLSRVAGKPVQPSENIKTVGKSLKETNPEQFAKLKAEIEARQKDMVPPGIKKSPSLLAQFMKNESGAVGAKKPPPEAQPTEPVNSPQDFVKAMGKAVLPEDITTRFRQAPSGRYSAATLKKPEAKAAAAISDDLYTMDQKDAENELAAMKAAAMHPEEFKNQATQEKIYLARESGKLDILTPAERTYYDKYLKPVFDTAQKLYEEMQKLDPRLKERASFDHVMRIVAGSSSIDPRDPIAGQKVGQQRALNTTTGPLMERSFKSLVDDDTGQKAVISLNDGGGYSKWNGGKNIHIPEKAIDLLTSKDNFETGSQVKIGDKTYTIQEATTPEIERNARNEDGDFMKYHKSAALSAYSAVVQIQSALMHMKYINQLMESKEWKANATQVADKGRENEWEKTVLKPFDNWYMAPEFKAVFDDYAEPGFAGNNSLAWAQNLSRQVTKLMFWLPTPHALNVGAHWFVARGWDWLTPKGWSDLAKTTVNSIQSVIKQDDFQSQLRQAGAGTMTGGIMTQEWMRNIAQQFGHDIERDPTKWDPVVKALGLSTARELSDAIYKGSSRIMWSANDMFMTQLIKQYMNNGMTMRDAIVKAERHIPNYRVPIEIMGSRLLSQLMQSPLYSAFGRYRYGVYNSYAHIVKDAVNGTKEERMEALGNMVAMGVLGLAVYPVLNKMAQLVTGNPDAEQRARGPIAVPTHIVKVLNGSEDLSTALGSTLTIPPMLSTALEAYHNQDWAGRKVVEPGDLYKAGHGSVKAMGRVALQEGEHAVRGLVSPVNTVENAIGRKQSLGWALRDSLMDWKNPSERARKFERTEVRKNAQAAKSRFKKPTGEIERLYNQALGK